MKREVCPASEKRKAEEPPMTSSAPVKVAREDFWVEGKAFFVKLAQFYASNGFSDKLLLSPVRDVFYTYLVNISKLGAGLLGLPEYNNSPEILVRLLDFMRLFRTGKKAIIVVPTEDYIEPLLKVVRDFDETYKMKIGEVGVYSATVFKLCPVMVVPYQLYMDIMFKVDPVLGVDKKVLLSCFSLDVKTPVIFYGASDMDAKLYGGGIECLGKSRIVVGITDSTEEIHFPLPVLCFPSGESAPAEVSEKPIEKRM